MASLPTSITFDKAVLIGTAESALATHAKADAAYQAAKQAYRDEHNPPSRRENIIALRDALSAFIKTKRAPTSQDAKDWRRLAGEDYLSNLYDREVSDNEVRNNVDRPAGWMPADRAASYRGLIAMLKAHVGDTITANQLKLFGYTNLEALFRTAATDPGGVK